MYSMYVSFCRHKYSIFLFFSVLKAMRKGFPTASIKGCVFHFTQAVWRKTQELGLKTTYT